MRKYKISFVLLLGALAACARSDWYVLDDLNLNTNTNYMEVGYSPVLNKFASPTVNILSGGSVNFLGETSGSIVNLNGGWVDNWSSWHSSTANVHSGTVGSEIYARDSSRVNVSGGKVKQIQASDATGINISGGVVDYLWAGGRSSVTVTSGNIRRLDVVGDLFHSEYSTTTLSGGTVAELLAWGGTVNVKGGSVTGHAWYGRGWGEFNVYGHNLTATSATSDLDGYLKYNLGGKLQDGTSLSGNAIYLQKETMATFHLYSTAESVPEPSAVALGLGGCWLGFLRQRRKK